jgi:hypothetical protein
MADEIIIETSTPEVIEVGLPGPQGPKGDTGNVGPANSLAIGTVTTGAAGSNASATITGTAPNQTLDLDIPRGDTGATGPQGPAATVAVGTVSTGAPGSPASVTNAGTSSAAILNFDIPQGATGATGPANSLAIGTVSTGAEGSNADATITGTAPNQTLNLTIPVGATGATGATGPQGPAGTQTTDAAALTTGTLADARLSTNVPLKDAANTFSANQTLNGTNNVAPNQTAASGSSIMTRDLVDARHPQKMTVTTTGVTNLYLADLLNSGTASSPGIAGFDGSGLTFQAASSTERLAFWRGATGAVTNQKTRAVLRGTNVLNQGIFWSANFAGTLAMRFRLNQTTDCQLTVGLYQPAAAGAGSIVDKNGAYLRYDAATDANFMFQNGATAANAVSSGVAVDTNWHVVRIRVVNTTSVFYSLDGGAETQVTASIGSASVSPAFFVMTTTNADKTADFSAVTLEATT